MTQKPSITISEALLKAAITPKQFAGLVELSLPSVYRALESKELPATRLNGRILISTKTLKKVMEGEPLC
jgi:excisionase family DNA binding protein